MSISKENLKTEIAALRDCQFAYCSGHAQSVRDLVNHLLDALEAAGAHAKTVEQERDALLEIIAEQDCPYDEGRCDKKIVAENSEETMCRQCWLKWLKENHGAEGAPA